MCLNAHLSLLFHTFQQTKHIHIHIYLVYMFFRFAHTYTHIFFVDDVDDTTWLNITNRNEKRKKSRKRVAASRQPSKKAAIAERFSRQQKKQLNNLCCDISVVRKKKFHSFSFFVSAFISFHMWMIHIWMRVNVKTSGCSMSLHPHPPYFSG